MRATKLPNIQPNLELLVVAGNEWIILHIRHMRVPIWPLLWVRQWAEWNSFLLKMQKFWTSWTSSPLICWKLQFSDVFVDHYKKIYIYILWRLTACIQVEIITQAIHIQPIFVIKIFTIVVHKKQQVTSRIIWKTHNGAVKGISSLSLVSCGQTNNLSITSHPPSRCSAPEGLY